ncbi:MAG: transposase [Deltaproteobacteria bacterium]|nr:transposase [Deltaproteobacteria bacterium]
MDPIDLVAGCKVNRFFRARNKLTHGSVVSHITQRAAGKDPCFVEDDDFLCMLGFLKESALKHNYEIFSFCLMGNHAHLLLRPSEDNLQDAMRDLFSRYAMRFNRKYERRGHLFGGPYRQAVCLDDAYLLAASTYIHLNPVKAEIVNDPKDYRWSSVRLFVDEPEKMSFVNAGFILKMLSSDLQIARKRYRTLLEKGTELPIDYAKTQESGVEHFKQMLIEVFPNIFKRMTAAKTVAKIDGKEILNMEALEQQIDETISQYGRRKPGSRKAMKFLVEQLIARGFKRSEIAECLHISPKTVYNILKSQT